MNKYLLGEDKFNDFYDLYLYSFNRPDSLSRKDVFKERFNHSLAYGIMNGTKLGSGLFSIPFDVNFHGVDFKMNGIGDVMSAPEFGGRGGAGSLMKAALSDMHQNKVTLSYLAPFAFGYYRQFGYEQTFDHTQITIRNTDLPRIKNSESGHVERIGFKDMPEDVKTLYFENNHLGGMVRADWWWNHMQDKHPDFKMALAYDDDDNLIGYLIYYSQDTTFYIQEWFNLNPLSRQLLAKFVTKHQSIFEQFIYESPDADFKADILSDPKSAQLEVKPYMMARIVDLEDFLLRYPVKKMNLAKVYFKVNDFLEWNDHTWALSINDGIVDLQIADGEGEDFEISIQDLTKAMFGYRSLNSLAKYGFISGDQAKINELNNVFVHQRPELIDYF